MNDYKKALKAFRAAYRHGDMAGAAFILVDGDYKPFDVRFSGSDVNVLNVPRYDMARAADVADKVKTRGTFVFPVRLIDAVEVAMKGE